MITSQRHQNISSTKLIKVRKGISAPQQSCQNKAVTFSFLISENRVNSIMKKLLFTHCIIRYILSSRSKPQFSSEHFMLKTRYVCIYVWTYVCSYMLMSSVISSYCQALNMLHVNRVLLLIICNIFENLSHLSYLFSYCFILRSLLLIFFNNLFIRSLSHLN